MFHGRNTNTDTGWGVPPGREGRLGVRLLEKATIWLRTGVGCVLLLGFAVDIVFNVMPKRLMNNIVTRELTP